LCVPIFSPGGVLTDGFHAIVNPVSAPLFITGVSLGRPHHGLRLLGAYVLPVHGNDLYGAIPGYPRRARMPRGEYFSQLTRAVGAQLVGKKTYNLLVVVRTGKTGGSASGLDIYYQVNGRQYFVPFKFRLTVATSSCH
jgi:hypothetical protein